MKISDTIGCVLKNRPRNRILSIAPEQTVFEALEMMAQFDVGALLVISQDELVGIFSERDYARRLNGMKKVVFSKSLGSADWQGSVLLRDIDAEQIRQWKQEDGKDMLIYGSASIVRQLSALGLIDEYQLLVHPVVLGGGLRLLEDKTRLKLVSARQFGSGVMLLTYVPAS